MAWRFRSISFDLDNLECHRTLPLHIHMAVKEVVKTYSRFNIFGYVSNMSTYLKLSCHDLLGAGIRFM